MSVSRTKSLERVAFRLGMSFQAEDRWGLHALLRDFHLFRRGRFRRITNMLSRPDPMLETQTYIFDYFYRQGKGPSGNHRQTVFFVHSKALALPWFSMKPENLFHKIGALLGYEDIDFEEFPEFSNQYRLRGEDESYIRATMNDPVLHFFSREKGWSLEGVNYYLIIYRQDSLLLPMDIEWFYEKGNEIFRLLVV